MYKRPMRKNETMKPFFVVLLVITVGAVIVGYFGTRYVIYPLFIKDNHMVVRKVESNTIKDNIVKDNRNTNTTNEQANHTTINSNSNEFIVYSVQLGNFGSRENAIALIEDLKEEGIHAYILNDNGYKVVTSPVIDYNDADIQKNNVKSFSEDAFILKRKFFAENETVEAALKNILNNISQAKKEENGEKYLEELRTVIKKSIDSQSLEQETVQVFQTMYEEVNKDNYKKELFELEKMIIMKIEEII
ncbi:MAG: SPOR domain-containing protein [Clostridia bacterium]|nr:SPOR domain-containing protein [Clostridia bacterium]